MKYILRMNEDRVEDYDTTFDDNYTRAYENTKNFDVSEECENFLHNQKGYLNGCKTCNEITDLTFTKYNGYYDTLCICNNCGNYILFERSKDKLYDNYMGLIKNMKKYNI